MNYQTAAVAGGVAFLLSLLAGLLGSVAFLDLLVRALFWAAFGFGGCLGAEFLLRSLVPDLFVARENEEPIEPGRSDRAVDITLDDDIPTRGGFIEEVDEDEVPVSRFQSRPEPVESPRDVVSSEAGSDQAAEPGDEEEMPEIGSFLDAFKPGAPEAGEEGGARAPEINEYSPVEPSPTPASRSGGHRGGGVEEEDPVILAKAVQTVMKRDVQGN